MARSTEGGPPRVLAVSPVDENPPSKFAVGDYAIATYTSTFVLPGLAQTIIASLGSGGRPADYAEGRRRQRLCQVGAYTQNNDGGWVVENTLRASGSPSEGKFQIGDTVRVTESLRLRTSPSTSAASIAVMPAGTTGKVVGGPQTGSGYTWWQLETSYGTGWAVQDWLTETDGGTTPPPTGKFAVGDTVRVTENLNMRSGPSTASGVITVIPAGTEGTVLDGPRTGSGYTGADSHLPWHRLGRGELADEVDGAPSPPLDGQVQALRHGPGDRDLNMRLAPHSNGVIAVLPAGTTGTVV